MIREIRISIMKNLKFEISCTRKMEVNEQICVITILLNVLNVAGECTIKETSYIGGIPLMIFNHYNGIWLVKKATKI